MLTCTARRPILPTTTVLQAPGTAISVMFFQFCPLGDSYEQVWVDNGFSRCFLEVSSSIVCSGVLIVLGVAQMVLAGDVQKRRSSWSPWMIAVIIFSLLQVNAVLAVYDSSFPILYYTQLDGYWDPWEYGIKVVGILGCLYWLRETIPHCNSVVFVIQLFSILYYTQLDGNWVPRECGIRVLGTRILVLGWLALDRFVLGCLV